MPERLPELLILVLGLLLSLSVAWAAHVWEASSARYIREDLAVYAQTIGQQLQSLVAATQALAQFYNHSDRVRPEAIYARIGPELVAALTGEPRHLNFQHTFPDGQRRYLEAHLSPFWIAGAVQGVVVSLHDVTKAAGKNRVILAGACHPLNNLGRLDAWA
ncbi:PAS domain-containing protein [uncultured Thiodictyon sp.]|uniref:PAS domain-containing protein n=1 Tax=uncultured Thiodictyon sp. TaxID=1846217 RepID=UPI00260101F0|nr:PAS domain-containing protein [uncultured Thiodictyon sp.]